MDEIPEIPPEMLSQLFPNGFTLRDEANAIVAWALRSGPLEDLHAGKSSKLLKDDSLSRITDAEKKNLMIHACKKVEWLLRLRESNPSKYDAAVKMCNAMYCKMWDRTETTDPVAPNMDSGGK